jgi:hypothetical protein
MTKASTRRTVAAVLCEVQPIDGGAVPHRRACAIEAWLRCVQPALDCVEVITALRHRIQLQSIPVLKLDLARTHGHGQVALVNLQVMPGAEQFVEAVHAAHKGLDEALGLNGAANVDLTLMVGE